MSRKRKLYLSEFLKTHEKKYSASINLYTKSNHLFEFKNFQEALEYEFLNELEIESWYYSEYLGYVILVK